MRRAVHIIRNEDLKDEQRNLFGDMLKEQGKVQGDFYQKADRCKLICILTILDEPVAIGGIKIKTESDFANQKANLPEIANLFKWELGYIYTRPKYEGNRFGSSVVKCLIDKYGNENLMASTEIHKNPAMVKILQKNGFRQHGKSWKSQIHGNDLGLFLKYKSGEEI